MTIRLALRILGLSAIVPALAGCATIVNEPSLAPRAIERLSAAEPASAPPPPVAIPQGASGGERSAALVEQARAADALFRERLAAAQAKVAAGSQAAIGSEAWVQAQQALSRADALRSGVTGSIADLEALRIAAAAKGFDPATATQLAGAISEVEAMEAGERAAIRSLAERLSAP